MAVCNIFKKLEKNTGTFLLFSQYTEDLTRECTYSEHYKIVPSKFILADIDYSSFSNEDIPRILQNSFENGCAICRNHKDINWTPDVSTNLFWDALFENHWLNIPETKEELGKISKHSTVNEFKYVGDINIQSVNEYEGMGYSEIYCYVPNDAKEYQYSVSINENDNNGNPIEIETGRFCLFPNKTKINEDEISFIEGYTPEEIDRTIGEISKDVVYHPKTKYTFNFNNKNSNINTAEKNSNEPNRPEEVIDSVLYTANTVIILYDIIQSDGTSLYSNIPMGVYFTGIKAENPKTLTNAIIKYIENQSNDIYNEGTSYGLRICTRYTPTANSDNIKVENIEIENDQNAILSKLMSQMSISQTKLDDTLDFIQKNSNLVHETYALFKNQRVNVPYIRLINNEAHWFVNGKDLGIFVANFPDLDIKEIETEYIDDMFENYLQNLKPYNPYEMSPIPNSYITNIYNRNILHQPENKYGKINIKYNYIKSLYGNILPPLGNEDVTNPDDFQNNGTIKWDDINNMLNKKQK